MVFDNAPIYRYSMCNGTEYNFNECQLPIPDSDSMCTSFATVDCTEGLHNIPVTIIEQISYYIQIVYILEMYVSQLPRYYNNCICKYDATASVKIFVGHNITHYLYCIVLTILIAGNRMSAHPQFQANAHGPSFTTLWFTD